MLIVLIPRISGMLADQLDVPSTGPLPDGVDQDTCTTPESSNAVPVTRIESCVVRRVTAKGEVSASSGGVRSFFGAGSGLGAGVLGDVGLLGSASGSGSAVAGFWGRAGAGRAGVEGVSETTTRAA